MATKKIFILLGNPDTDTYSGKLADSYQAGAEAAGHDVFRVNINDLNFDPVLHKGYKEIQALEPDLIEVQERIYWADHLVIIYPNWWCAMPALLKGLFDRIWLPGFAFSFDKDINKPSPRLSGKTARVIIITGSHSPFSTWWRYGDFTNEIQHGILGFAGVKAAISAFGPTQKVDEKKKTEWLQQVKKLGESGR